MDDLDLKGTEYSWISSIFYFGFLVWAFLTNFLMQRFPVGKHLGVNIFLWGFFLMLQGALFSSSLHRITSDVSAATVKNFTQLAVLRAISGAAEACR